jgi:uncharacterized membrane protein
MLYLVAIVLGVLLGIVFKGKLSNLLNIKFEKIWIAIMAFVAQTLLRVLTLNGLEIVSRYGLIVHCTVYGLLLVGFWFNRHYAGMCIIGLGCFSNALVMALNGGKMPVSVEALAKAQMTGMENILQSGMDGKHVILDESTRLYFLADIINLPPVLGVLMPVVSIGDLIIAAGIFILAFCGVRGSGLK